MTSRHDLTREAAALRQAVIEGRYAEAKQLLLEYTSAIAELRNPDAAAEACGLMEWARKLTLGRKAAVAARVAAIPASIRRYGETRVQGAHTWDLVG